MGRKAEGSCCSCFGVASTFPLKCYSGWQDAVVWNSMYIVKGRQAIFGAVNLWCSMNKIEVKINRMGEQHPMRQYYS